MHICHVLLHLEELSSGGNAQGLLYTVVVAHVPGLPSDRGDSLEVVNEDNQPVDAGVFGKGDLVVDTDLRKVHHSDLQQGPGDLESVLADSDENRGASAERRSQRISLCPDVDALGFLDISGCLTVHEGRCQLVVASWDGCLGRHVIESDHLVLREDLLLWCVSKLCFAGRAG